MNFASTISDVQLCAAPRDATAARESTGPMLRYLAIACWLLMLMTFSPPGGRIDASDTIDTIALAKIGTRALVFGALALAAMRQWNNPRRRIVTRLFLPWFLFAVWIVLSASWSALKTVSLGQAGSFGVLLLVGFHVALQTERITAEYLLKQVTWGLLIACVCLLAIYAAIPSWECLTRSGRGLMHATNGAATSSIGCILLLAARWLFGWRWSRSLFWPGMIVFLATMILAQNRTTLGLTFLVATVLAGCISPFWRAAAMAVCGIGGAIYLAIDMELGLTNSILDSLSTYLARGQTASQLTQLSGREEMWTKMWNSYLESPWIGHGYFVSSAKGEMYVWYWATNWTAHNFWLQILVSTGLVGCLMMAWAMSALIFRLLRSLFQDGTNWRFTLFLGSLVLWQIGWGVNNESFVGPLQPESVVFFVILGLATGRYADAVQSRRQPRTELKAL